MMPAVTDAHSASQGELDRLVKELHACSKDKETAWKGVGVEVVKYKKGSPLHKTCRSDEAVRFTSKKTCLEEQRNKKNVKALKCKLFAETSKRVGDGNANRQITKRAGGESVETYVKRISATICGLGCRGGGRRRHKGGGGGGGGKGGFLDDYEKAKKACETATRQYNTQVKTCKQKSKEYGNRKRECNALQDLMDASACKGAVLVKDACETYAECFNSKKETYATAKKAVQTEEKDRKAEWRGLKRMLCLITSFEDKQVTDAEVAACKKASHSTKHLEIKYPEEPKLKDCAVPKAYPDTIEYKKLEFVPLPALAKGKAPQECAGMDEVSTTPATGSPKDCKCSRVTMTGPYSPGPLVKCENCLDARRSKDKNSCPDGTKLFSPRSQTDWETFIKSASPLRNPHFIVDITRPQNGCAGCTTNAMNSGNSKQKSWRTADGSPWWLRSSKYGEPNGDYEANCYMGLGNGMQSTGITMNDGRCGYHSKSYYCQARAFSSKPTPGSPPSCKCTKVELAGKYSAGLLLKCEQCIKVSKSTQKNSCPSGMKIFSPASRQDWATFIKSAAPLRSPNWIIDITRPANGCGGCTKHAMNSGNPHQATWKTSDGSAWWLRSTKYGEPNGDYHANCFMDLWHTPANENAVTFNDHNCKYSSISYYCQPSKKKHKSKKLR